MNFIHLFHGSAPIVCTKEEKSTLGMYITTVYFSMQVLDATLEKFSLIRLYPRQELTSDMDLQSLKELNLVPTGVVIVKMDKVHWNCKIWDSNFLYVMAII